MDLKSKLFEKVVTFIVNQDKGREVHNFDLPDGFHAELREVDAFDFGDVLVSKQGGRAADGAEVEPSELLAGIGYLLGAVTLGDHNH